MKLKELIDDYLDKGRHYFINDNTQESMDKYLEARGKIYWIHKDVHHLLDWSPFMVVDDTYTYEQIYHVIEYLTGVQIEDDYLYQPVGTE